MKVVRINSNTAKYTFVVSPEDFEHGLSHAYEQIKKDVAIDGFRKGHVPQKQYETKFGVESLFEDALNHVFAHKFDEAIKDPTFRIVGDPDIDLDISTLERGKEFEFSFIVPIKPDIVLGEYKGIEVEAEKVEVSEEDIENALEAQLQKGEVLKDKEEGVLEEGDTAIFDFEGLKDGVAFEGGTAENYQLEIGSGQFIPGFEEQMVGMKPEEQKDINVTFPENYQEESLQGQPVVFKVKLWEIKVRVRPELDDAWVRNQNKEAKTVAEYKELTRKELLEAKEAQERARVTDQVVLKASENAEMDIPQAMITNEVNSYKQNLSQQAAQYGLDLNTYVSFSGQTMEQFEETIAEQAETRIRQMLTIEQIMIEEKIGATKEEIANKYTEIATQYNMPVAEIKKHIDEASINMEVGFGKTLDFLYENAKIIK